MRKLLFSLLLLLALMLSCASADSFVFDSIYATCEISEDYIILTPDNLDRHPEWVEKIAADQDTLLEDFAARGVLLQAWTQSGDACLEITAVQDELGKRLFDIDQQITQTRTNYRVQHSKGEIYADNGHVYSSAEWKKTNQYGRFLLLKYTCTNDEGTHKGYARRTIRNGYTITLDYKVFDRSLKTADQKAVDKILGTWKFTTTLPKPDECVPKLVFTSIPLRETYTGEFKVAGTGDPGLEIEGVLMRMVDPDNPIILEETVNKSGKFSMDVALPEEGIWLLTLTVYNNGAKTEEVFFNYTKYDKDELPINLDEPIPEQLTADTFTVSGLTMRQTKVQCIVDGIYDKQVTTNNTGKFSFKVPTNKEGEYTFTLVFEKKNYDTRRVEYTATRTLTEAEIRDDIRELAVKPAYSTLTQKITGYTGRTMGYNLYVKSIEPSGNEWITFMSMRKTNSGDYRDIVVVMSKEEPTFAEGTQVKMYGTCTGEYDIIDSDGKTTSYPSFDLLFWDY